MLLIKAIYLLVHWPQYCIRMCTRMHEPQVLRPTSSHRPKKNCYTGLNFHVGLL